MTPFETGLALGAVLGTSLALALVLVAVFIRAEWAHHDAELRRAFDRESRHDA